MSHTLTQLWKDQPAFLESKTFEQIIKMTGDGRLKDGNATSSEIRDWLKAVPLKKLQSCAEDCLKNGFEDSGHALQDVVNEIGNRLDFKVQHGLYRGKQNAIGNDGIWTGGDKFGLIVEVKTTDAYRINLDTVVKYRKQLVANGTLDVKKSSILIIVGRQDTGDLEAQIRGSQHAWDVRLISVDSLMRLAEVKEQLTDWNTSNKINQLLRPLEYTRLDGIVELLFATKQDLDTPETIEPPQEEKTRHLDKVDMTELNEIREKAVIRIGNKLEVIFVKRGKAIRASSDGKIRLVCLASRRFKGPSGAGNYWFGFTQSQKDFIQQAESGYVAMLCSDTGRIFLVTREAILGWLPKLLTTPSGAASIDDVVHWHLYINDYGSHADLLRSSSDILADASNFLVTES